MFSIFKKDPTKQLKKQLSAKLEKAMIAQRNGDIKTYSFLSYDALEIDKKITEIEKTTKS